MQKQTTGAVISRLGALTVRANNMLGEPLDPQERVDLAKQIQTILNGEAGVPAQKVAVRSMERCVLGGAAVVWETPLGPISWGLN